MTTLHLNAEICSSPNCHAGSEDYLLKALNYLKKLSCQDRQKSNAMAIKKIHAANIPLHAYRYNFLSSILNIDGGGTETERFSTEKEHSKIMCQCPGRVRQALCVAQPLNIY